MLGWANVNVAELTSKCNAGTQIRRCEFRIAWNFNWSRSIVRCHAWGTLGNQTDAITDEGMHGQLVVVAVTNDGQIVNLNHDMLTVVVSIVCRFHSRSAVLRKRHNRVVLFAIGLQLNNTQRQSRLKILPIRMSGRLLYWFTDSGPSWRAMAMMTEKNLAYESRMLNEAKGYLSYKQL